MTTDLQAIYDQVPKVYCKGLCTKTCTIAPCSAAERGQYAAKGLQPPQLDKSSKRCSYLIGGRCRIYSDRPLICRLYGATPQLKCIHGCKVEGGRIPDSKAKKLIKEIERITPAAIGWP